MGIIGYYIVRYEAARNLRQRMTDNTVSHQRHLPNLERCRTMYLGQTLDFSSCLMENPRCCEYTALVIASSAVIPNAVSSRGPIRLNRSPAVFAHQNPSVIQTPTYGNHLAYETSAGNVGKPHACFGEHELRIQNSYTRKMLMAKRGLKRTIQKVYRALRSRKGQSLVEYSLILALIAIVAITVLRGLGKHVNNTLSSINANLP